MPVGDSRWWWAKAKDAAPLASTVTAVVLLLRACLYGIPVPWLDTGNEGATQSPPDNGASEAPSPGLPPPKSLSDEELEPLLEPIEPQCPAPWNQVRHLQWTEPPPTCIDPEVDHTATLVTSRGNIVIELDTEKAPNTVNNFVFLARWHFYDGVEFNPVYPDYALNTGDPLGDPVGTFDPGYSIPGENLPQGKATTYPDYSVSMGTGGHRGETDCFVFGSAVTMPECRSGFTMKSWTPRSRPCAPSWQRSVPSGLG